MPGIDARVGSGVDMDADAIVVQHAVHRGGDPILDTEGLDALREPRPPEQLRALLHEAWARARDVLVPAVVCAESCRGVAWTRRVEAALSPHGESSPRRPAPSGSPS